MLKLGLTGGIASGKTWVADKLRGLGFRVLDADSLGHKLIQPGESAYSEIVDFFGSAILSSDNLIDRKRLGAIVFADAAKLAKLNAILHPKIEAAMNDQFEAWRRQGITDPVFVEAALLVEAGMHKRLDGLVVVWCTPTQQLNRLVARGLKEPEARRRISLQMPPDEKLKYATYQIDTSGTFEQSQQQIEALAKKLRNGAT